MSTESEIQPNGMGTDDGIPTAIKDIYELMGHTLHGSERQVAGLTDILSRLVEVVPPSEQAELISQQE